MNDLLVFLIDNAIWFWLIIFVLMVVIEFATTDFVTIWFAASAIPTLIVAAIWPERFLVQTLIFVIAGIALLVLTRPALVKYFRKNITHTNVDSFVGKTAIVTKTITPIERGLVNFERQTWTAVSNEEILEGASVKILAIEGNKFVVEKIKNGGR